MSKIIVLGGCGAVGSVAVKTLHQSNDFNQIIIGDYNHDRARQLAAEMNAPNVSACFVDALDHDSILKAIHGCDIVLNCVGPFYNTVKPILAAVMEKQIAYIDVCDDVDVTLEILDMHDHVRQKGLQVILGMGNSPGITNILGKLVSELFLDETHSIDIFHTHGGEAVEGEGVIGHRFHCMSIDCPMYLNGQLVYVKYFEDDGIALRQTFDFPVIGEVPIYPYPHPEQVTLPRYIQLNQVTNKGSVIPNDYYNLTRDLCGLGFNSKEPITVKGQTVVPYDFAVAYILNEREKMLKASGINKPCGCVSVVTKGIKEGEYKEYRFHLVSEREGLGEGTGIPAAVGAIMLNRGMIDGKGVMPPEACIRPMDFLKTVGDVYELTGNKTDGSGTILLEMVDQDGTITPIDISNFSSIS
ncbi:MAG: saccharopine dehydrogenase [Candidatus Magnetoglobus multicellularis str. Araruama]|uniref:Saccharopine dehydrogenase n=1 Tax=Candidatus Magnetoglobus multicellularis str. Araruama TaxID=890399 RepID=A0A1V1PB98_9BACT|nr:MAG: saccharopine dehydrogenase [Candidatus Magnetoglobus multicellularis str. Araruama]